MSEIIDGEFRESSALALRDEIVSQPPASLNLFGTDDPALVVEKATKVADALFAVVEKQKLYKNIQGKKYLYVEAWQFMGMMLGVTTFAEWSRPVDNGWEARAVVRTARGVDIGAAEAQCLRSETRWKTADDYAVRSMALTRATSKALRSVLAFIAVLAGYAPTPSEEMPDTAPARPSEPAQRGMTKAEARAAQTTVEGQQCPRCNAPAGRPHATACPVGRPPDPGRDAAPEVAPEAPAEKATLRAVPDRAKASANLTCPEGAAQHGFLFALHGELGHTDSDRADLYERIGGVRSHAKLSPADFRKVIDFMNAAISKRDSR